MIFLLRMCDFFLQAHSSVDAFFDGVPLLEKTARGNLKELNHLDEGPKQETERDVELDMLSVLASV